MRKRMGWKFPFVSSYHSDFNYDFNVSFTREDIASGRTLYKLAKRRNGRLKSKISLATAFSTKMRPVRSFTLTRLSDAAEKSSSEFTGFST